MRVNGFVALLLVTLCACHRPAPAKPAEGIDTVAADAVRAEKARANEQLLLAQYPQLATRDGARLTIRYAGKELTTYTDDDNGCKRYTVIKALRMRDNISGKREPIAEINCRFGYLDNNYLVLPTSDKFTIVADVAASTDGRWLAMDDNSIAGSRGDLTIATWPDMAKVARFDARCDNLAWREDKALSATCQHVYGLDPNDDSKAVTFRADIFQTAGGGWRMKGTQWVTPASGKALPVFEGVTPERYRDPLQIESDKSLAFRNQPLGKAGVSSTSN